MGIKRLTSMTLSGREFKVKDFKLIKKIVSLYPDLSRTELAKTICELLEWYQSDGEPKYLPCLTVLEKLEQCGHIQLPALHVSPLKGVSRKVKITGASDPERSLSGKVNEYGELSLKPAVEKKEISLWKEYIERYHYLGHKNGFGCQQKYFIELESEVLLGCFSYSASAWSLACRDKWIGWNKEHKSQNLHLIISNSRFLIFPWIKIKNLVSKVLSLSAKQVPSDWEERYNYRPVMFETFVERDRFTGAGYRASNWKYLGVTRGRGRMDRHNQCLSSLKDIYVYPLCADFREQLCGEDNNG